MLVGLFEQKSKMKTRFVTLPAFYEQVHTKAATETGFFEQNAPYSG